MKKCTKCLKTLAKDRFDKRRLSKDRLDTWCKSCKKVHNANKSYEPTYDGSKKCASCRQEKPKIDFNKSKRSSDGLEGRCKSCGDIRSRNNYIKKDYGITELQYQELLKRQDGKCAICSTLNPGPRVKRLSIDHSHSTKVVRGLLCNSCNNGLGRFKDDPILLQKASEYLLMQE